MKERTRDIQIQIQRNATALGLWFSWAPANLPRCPELHEELSTSPTPGVFDHSEHFPM